MNKTRKATVSVKGTAIAVMVHREEDYLSLTDIARHKDSERTDYLISNCFRNRNTIEFLGIWEALNNPRFNLHYCIPNRFALFAGEEHP